MTMSAEATEQVGPIIVWRKEIRENSGGAGKQRGGLGQIIEIGPTDGYLFEFSAMFDRVDNPSPRPRGGEETVRRERSTSMTAVRLPPRENKPSR